MFADVKNRENLKWFLTFLHEDLEGNNLTVLGINLIVNINNSSIDFMLIDIIHGSI